MTSPIITLVLRTSDLTTDASNEVGYSNEFKTSMTWRNINFRNVLGRYFDEYDEFKINLSQYVYTSSGVYGNAEVDRYPALRISGLPFVNYYESARGHSTGSSAIIKYIDIDDTYTLSERKSNIESGLTFGSFGGNGIRDITLTYEKFNSFNTIVTTTTEYPDVGFIFTIYPIHKKVDHHIKNLNI